MSKNSHSRNLICIALRSAGFPEETSKRIHNQLLVWIKASGEEWTVSRLKMLKVYYLKRLAGEDDFKPAWVTIGRSGLPSGPFGPVFKCRKPQKVLSALCVYTALLAKKVTPSQFKKFHSSVQSPDRLTRWGREEFSSFTTTQLMRITGLADTNCALLRGYEPKRVKPFQPIHAFVRKEIRVPTAASNCRKTAPNNYPDVLRSFGHPLIKWWCENSGEVIPPEFYHAMLRAAPMADNEFVGRVGFIQEPGYKLRAVANPLPSFQLVLSSFAETLWETLRQQPNDYTFDQEAGVEAVKEALKQGIPLESLDLADATNNFPLDAIVYCLRNDLRLKLAEVDLDLFVAVSRAKWAYPKNPGRVSSCTWTWGTPLGVVGGFAAFALAHHRVVSNLNPTFYAILGDDIVIDQMSASKLKSVYDELGVPLSHQKCLRSYSTAEFAGKVIHLEKVYTSPKYHQASDRSFLALSRNLGARIVDWFRPRQKSVASFFKMIHKQDLPAYGLLSTYPDPERELRSMWLAQEWETLREARLAKDTLNLETHSSRNLDQLRTRLETRYLEKQRKLRISYPVEEPSEETESSKARRSSAKDPDVKELLLSSANINRLEADAEEQKQLLRRKQWAPQYRNTGGDPRGHSTLSVVEPVVKQITDTVLPKFNARTSGEYGPSEQNPIQRELMQVRPKPHVNVTPKKAKTPKQAAGPEKDNNNENTKHSSQKVRRRR